ncbi:MAG: serine hydrolase domain-containing protein [Cyclobacteriaceae bacterium]
MKAINKINILVSLLFLSAVSYSQESEEPESPKTVPELQSAIEKVLEETGTPAAGVAMVHGDSVVWVAGLGQANIENEVAADENTMFRIGSTSKMYASLSILKLQQEGRVSLKDKVRDLVPDVEFENPWAETAPILVEHLLEHTTGWDDIHLTEYAFQLPDSSRLKEGLDYHPHSRISRWMPGTRMSYCNSGPPVAAYIVETITGQKFEDYVQETFFDPMGMENMSYYNTEAYKKLGASLYIRRRPQEYWQIIMRPSGSINASATDMAKMVRFFLNRGRVDTVQIISEESLKRMETSATTIGGRAGLEYGYGLSNYSSSFRGFVYRSHNGGVNGGAADFSYLPMHNVGYAIMINSGSGAALRRIGNLIREFQTKDLVANEKDWSTATSEGIAGYYTPINPRNQTFYFLERLLNVEKVWQKQDTVYRQDLLGGNVTKYLQKGDREYISPETGKISLVRVEDPLDGDAIQANTDVLKRSSAWFVFGQLIIGGLWILLVISSMIFGCIWAIRYWIGTIEGGSNIWVRLWPLITSFLFLVAVIAFMIGSIDPFALLGRVSVISISLMILTICFAVGAAWSVFYIYKERGATINKIIYWHSAMLAGLHMVATCYLLWHGVIGIRIWS